MDIIKTDGVDIRSWCPEIELDALEQMKVIAKLPYVTECCLMPDSHVGMSMPIGGIVACKDVIVPQMVGSDCGCGMCAMKTSIKVEQLTEDVSKNIFNQLQRDIPVGFSRNSDRQIHSLFENYTQEIDKMFSESNIENSSVKVIEKELRKEFASQLGTLGGG
jgi:tRNA-splicing ligase RtcB (3'-phosphate/5'-hydroxy nucleic acid ligase)